MRTASIGVALFALAALPALPGGPTAAATTFSLGDRVRWAEHHDVADARIAITTVDGKLTLLLTDRVVAFQLSDRTLRKVEREMKHKVDEQENGFGAAFASAVLGTVRDLIDSSFECRVRDVRDVYFADGRLVFLARDGKLVFDDSFCDEDSPPEFSERDARAFIREFRRLKAEK